MDMRMTIADVPDATKAERALWATVGRLASENGRTLHIQTQECKPCAHHLTQAKPGCCIVSKDSVIVCIRSEFLPRDARGDILSHELAHGHHLASQTFDGSAVMQRVRKLTGKQPTRALTVLFHQHVFEMQVKHGVEPAVLETSFHGDFAGGRCAVDCWFEWLNKGVSCLGAVSIKKRAADLFPSPMAEGIVTICDLLLNPSEYLRDIDAAAERARELGDAIRALTTPPPSGSHL